MADKLVTYDPATKKHTPTPDGYKIDPALIDFPDAPAPAEFLSQDLDNLMQLGQDAKLAVKMRNLLSTDSGQKIEVGSDGRLYYGFTNAEEVRSNCTGNALIIGCDGGIYLDENLLGGAYTLGYVPLSGELTLYKSGTPVSTVTIQSSASVLEEAGVVVDPEGLDPGTYIFLRFKLGDDTEDIIYVNVSTLIDIYEAGNNGIRVDGYAIFLKLRDSEGPLQIDGDAGSDTGGLYIDISALVSSDIGNTLEVGADGKLKVSGGVNSYIELVDTPDSYTTTTGANSYTALTSDVIAAPNILPYGVLHTNKNRWVQLMPVISPGGTTGVDVFTLDSTITSGGSDVYNNYQAVCITHSSEGNIRTIQINGPSAVNNTATVMRDGFIYLQFDEQQVAGDGYAPQIVLGSGVYWINTPPADINNYPNGIPIRYKIYNGNVGPSANDRGFIVILENLLEGASAGGGASTYHVNLEFGASDAEVRFYIPEGLTTAIITPTSVMSDLGTTADYSGVTISLAPTYPTATATLTVGQTDTTLINQAGTHVTATISGWPDTATAVSMDVVFQ